jgi:DNA-binding winged helix-turn-helix (wHTH) protein/Tfp pilus assembly protein PilF
MPPREQYTFADFVFDVSDRRLSKGGRPIPLEPKAHDVLVALVRNAGRLVTKDELMDLVWPASYVADGILAVHVSNLRKALGDRASQPDCIETVSRSGYRFVAQVTQTNGASNGLRQALGPARRPEVYELLGRGRSHLRTFSLFEVPKAVAAFRAAIELDPSYAVAHANLALACCTQVDLRAAPHAESFAEARAAALRALAMDDGSADAQVALGAVLFLSEWNWLGAEKSFVRALELNRDHSDAYLLYGRLAESLGRLDEGLELKLRALEREPFSPVVHLQISMSYWNQRRYDQAIEWANKALAIDPEHPHAREHLSAAYLKKGDYDRHLAENITHARRHGMPAEALEPLKAAYAAEGRMGIVKYVLAQASNPQSRFPPLMLAIFHGEAGNLDAAFDHLQRALADRDPALVHLAVGPQWDCLRGDARFDECLGQMGLTHPVRS